MTAPKTETGQVTPHELRVEDVLPQKPPMVLLDSILSHTVGATSCTVRIGPSAPFADADGAVPSWVALEYMAQCAAAHSGLCEREKGLPIRIGFLLGSRRIVFHAALFSSGQELEVSAHETWNDDELASFECAVRDRCGGALLAECQLVAYSPHRIEGIIERQLS